MPSLKYVPNSMQLKQTAFCAENFLRQPLVHSWQNSQRRESHTSRHPLPTPGLIFLPILRPIRRTTEKKWGVLSTCLSARAVRVEVVPWTLFLL